MTPRPNRMLYEAYRLTAPPETCENLRDVYDVVLWKPGPLSILPPTLTIRFVIWWIFHYFGILGSGMYRVLLIRHKGAVVHRSCMMPKYFRWPFMSEDDLQISSTWTDPAHRGRGLATFALRHLVSSYADGRRRFWYISREDNRASITVCLRCGFQFQCLMRRTHPWGSLLFGRFLPVAEKTYNESLAADHR
jgi:RimJ/RimL family protein N-acetyltransferase